MMSLFVSRSRYQQELSGVGILLRLPQIDDFERWRSLRAQSAGFLIPFEPRWPSDDLTKTGFRRRIDKYLRDAMQGSGFTWFIFGDDGRTLLGGLSLSAIRHGASRSGSLGYWMGEPHAGKGIMKKAVGLVLAEAFGRLGLERIEAACLPHNNRSVRLLQKCGFSAEGRARDYLEIDGIRRDHLLFAILKSDFSWINAVQKSGQSAESGKIGAL
jgi:ribosomal-protein-alanine N-acetyltransferase